MLIINNKDFEKSSIHNFIDFIESYNDYYDNSVVFYYHILNYITPRNKKTNFQ